MKIYKKILDSQKSLEFIAKNKKELVVKAKFGPSKLTRIPLELNEELAFFIGAIIGDGHLKRSKFQTTIELTDKKLIIYLQVLCERLFRRRFKIRDVKQREGRKQTFVMGMDSKAIYLLLKDVFEIPSGKKSHIVKIPEYIKNSKEKIKIAFLEGIMATEGGKRKRGFGLSTASKKLWEDLIILFEEVQIPVLRDFWEYKKYKKKYYGISFRKEHMKKLMRMCRSGQTGCV